MPKLKSCFVLFPKALELGLVMTKLLLAVLTGKAGVGAIRKALGCESQSKLPTSKQDQGKPQKAPGVQLRNKDQGGKHHSKVPVVDATDSAAAVLQDPGLEGTEEQDADHITNTKEKADQNQNSLVDPSKEIQQSNGTVEGDPNKEYG